MGERGRRSAALGRREKPSVRAGDGGEAAAGLSPRPYHDREVKIVSVRARGSRGGGGRRVGAERRWRQSAGSRARRGGRASGRAGRGGGGRWGAGGCACRGGSRRWRVGGCWGRGGRADHGGGEVGVPVAVAVAVGLLVALAVAVGVGELVAVPEPPPVVSEAV